MDKTSMFERKRSAESVITGHEAKRPAILRNGARSINLASGTLRVKPMKPSPPPMRPLHTPALTVNTPERMTNGLTTSPVQKADGKRFTAICVESKLENEKAQKVHSETQTHACFGYKPKAITDIVSSRVNEVFELLSKPLAERIASLEEENKQLQTRLLQANERLATIKEMANKSNKQQQTASKSLKQLSPQSEVMTEPKLSEHSIQEVVTPVTTNVTTTPRVIQLSPPLTANVSPSQTTAPKHDSVNMKSLCTGDVNTIGGMLSVQPSVISQQRQVISMTLSTVNGQTLPVSSVEEKQHSSACGGGGQFLSPGCGNNSVRRTETQDTVTHTQNVDVLPYNQSAVLAVETTTQPLVVDKTSHVDQVNRSGYSTTQVDLTSQPDFPHCRSPNKQQQWTNTSTKFDHSNQYEQSVSAVARPDRVDVAPYTQHLEQSASSRNAHTTRVELTEQLPSRVDLTVVSDRVLGWAPTSVQQQQQQQQQLSHRPNQLTQQHYSQRFYPPQRNPYPLYSPNQHCPRPQYSQQRHIHQPAYSSHPAGYITNIRTTANMPNRTSAAVPVNLSSYSVYAPVANFAHAQQPVPGMAGNNSCRTLLSSNSIPTPVVSSHVTHSGIVLQWTLSTNDFHKSQIVDRYELYAYQGNSPLTPQGSHPDPKWNKVGTVKALPLPMQCILTQFMKGRTYYFVIRAIDAQGHPGGFSKRCFVNLP